MILLLLALPAFAQEPEVQRALIERDQMTQEFAARLRGAPLIELQRLENLSARQQLEVRKDLPPELRPYERQSAAREFVLQFAPPVVRAPAPEKPRPLSEKFLCWMGLVPAESFELPTFGLQNRCSTS